MKKILLSLLGVLAIASIARAGTIYERTTLENVAQSGEKFALFASGPIYSSKFGNIPKILWASSFVNGSNSNGAPGYATVPTSMRMTPDRFNRSIVGNEEGGYNRLPALFTLEDAGTGTIDDAQRQLYFLKATCQPTRESQPTDLYVGISATTGVLNCTNQQPTSNGHKMFFDPASATWTDYTTGENLTSNTCYKISSVSQQQRGLIMLIHDKNGVAMAANSAALTPIIDWSGTPGNNTNKRYPIPYKVTNTVEQICGVGNEPSYSIALGVGQSIPAPTFLLKTVREGGNPVTPYVVDGNVTYKYEVEEGSDVLSIAADGSFTGLGEGTARVRVTLSDESARFFDIEEPYYIDVTVGKNINITLSKVDTPSTLASTDAVVFVSATPFTNGKGYVAAGNTNASSGVMFSTSVLPGYTALPAEMELPVTTLDGLRQFTLSNAAETGKIVIRNSGPSKDKQLGGEKNYAIRYGAGTTNWVLETAEEGGFIPKTSPYSWRLGFFNGTPPALSTQVSYSTQVSELVTMNDISTLVPIYFYKINKIDARIDALGEVSLNQGENANVSALLMAPATNGEFINAPAATFSYQVVDAQGNAFASGQAPVTVAADGTITVVKPGTARIVVTLNGDYARYCNTEPAYCDVIVRTPAFMFLGDAYEDMEVELFAGESVTLPAATLKGSEDGGADLSGVSFTYVLANDEYEPWYDAQGNPVLSNDLFSVDPVTGVVTSQKGVEGDAYIVPVMTPETEKYYMLGGEAHQFVYHVTVNPPLPATLGYENGNENPYVNIGSGESATVPSPALTVDGKPVENISFVYTVINPATGEPYAEGEAPITVDADGNITIVEGKSGAAIVQVSLSEEDALKYHAEPINYEVNVTRQAEIAFADTTPLVLPYGTAQASVPAPALTVDGNAVPDIKYVYEVVDADGNPFAEGEAPISVDENGNITILNPGQAFVKVSLSDDDAKNYQAAPALYEVNITKEAQIFVDNSSDNTVLDAAIGSTTKLPVPELKVNDGNGNFSPIDGASFTFALCDAEGNPLKDAEGNLITENERVSVNPLTGEVTIKDGAEEGEVFIAAVLTGDSTNAYHTNQNHIYTVYVAQKTTSTFVRVTSRPELDVVGMEGVLLVSGRKIGDKGFVTATKKDLTDVSNTNFAPRTFHATELVDRIELNNSDAAGMMRFNIYHAYGVDSKVNEENGYRVMLPDGRYVYRTYYTQDIDFTTHAGIDAANGGGGFWYPLTVANGYFQLKTGGNYLGFDDAGTLKHVGAGAANTAVYAPYTAATMAKPEEFSGSVTISMGQSTQLPVPTFTIAGENPRQPEGIPFKFTVVDADGNPIENGIVVIDEDGNVTGEADGTARIMVTVAEPFDKFFDVEPIYYEVSVSRKKVYTITFADGSVSGSVTVAEGVTGVTLPAVQLIDENDNVETMALFQYQVINPATNEPFAEGEEVPISVDGEGNITTLRPGHAVVRISLDESDAPFYNNPEPVTYDVTVATSSFVAGVNGETAISLQIDNGKSAQLPVPVLKTVENGQEVEVPGASFVYEVINPETGEAYPDGQAPVTVDPATGKVTATDKSGEAIVKVSVDGRDASPLYIDVTVKDYKYVTLVRVNDLSTLTEHDKVVMVSARPINGKGFVSPSYSAVSMGIDTGSEGNMPPVAILPGQSELPAKLALTTEQADSLRTFAIHTDGTAYGFRILNGNGEGKYLKCERADRIRYLSNSVIGYDLNAKSEGVYAPAYGNFYLNFKANGVLSTFASTNANANGADVVFYSIVKPKADIKFESGTNTESVNIPSGKSGESVPTPVVTDENDEPVEGVTFVYTVIDPKTGEPFADGEAPIIVDELGNIATIDGKTGEAQIIVTLSDESADEYDAEPAVYTVNVTTSTFISGANDEEEFNLQLGHGAEIDIPGLKVEKIDPHTGVPTLIEDVKYVYEIINPSTGEPYAEGEAPVTVDPATGKIIATNNPGEAQIKVTLEGRDSEPLYIDVTVKDYQYVTLRRVTDPSTLEAGDAVVFVSSRPLTGKGFVSAAAQPESMGIDTGSTGNMPPVGVLAGRTELPEELVMTTEQAEGLRTFNLVKDGEVYGIRILNGAGSGQYLRSERNDRIRYLSNTVSGYTLSTKSEGVFAPEYGNYYLNFKGNGVLTSFTSTLTNADGADIVLYSIVRPKAEITFENGGTTESVNIPAGKTGESVPTPVLTDSNDEPVEGVTFKYTVIDPATGEPFAEGEAPVTVDEQGNITTVEGKTGEARIVVELDDEFAAQYDAEPAIYNVNVTNPVVEPGTVYITYRKVNSSAELEELAAQNAGIIAVSARAIADKGFVAASKVTDANNNFQPISILDGETELPAEFNLASEDADQLLSVYAVKQGEHFGFKLPAGHYLKRTVNNKVVFTGAFHGYAVSDHKAPAKVRAAVSTQAEVASNDGFRLMSGNNYLGFVANGNLSHQNSGNIFTNGAAPVFYTINKVEATAKFADGSTTAEETLDKGATTTIPEVKLTTEQDGKTVDVDGVTYKYEVVDSEGNVIPAATSPVTIDPETGEITAVKGGDVRIKITPADNGEMMYETEPVYLDISVPASDAKLVVDGKDVGTVTVSDDTTDTVTVPKPTLVDAENNPIDANNLTYTYEVVDANGNPFPAGEAPITVDENGNITVKPGSEGEAYVKVSLSGDAADEYKADPYIYEVVVNHTTTDPVITIGDNDIRSMTINKDATEAAIPTPELTVDGVREDDAKFTYTVVDANGQPFASDEAPISINPETGEITVLKPGTASVIVALAEDSAEHLGVDPAPVTVRVEVSDTKTSIIGVEAAREDDALYFNLKGVQVKNPVPGFYIRVSGNKAEKILVQ